MHIRLSHLLAAAAILGLAACDKPKPRAPAPPPMTPASVAAGVEPGAPAGAGAMPALPAWSADMIGKPLETLFPGERKPCVGNTDNVEATYANGVQIVGWGWDPAAKAPVGRILLVDTTGMVAGAGETGVTRPDVNKAKPEITSPTTGWAAYTARKLGPVQAFGIIDGGKSLCVLGRVDY